MSISIETVRKAKIKYGVPLAMLLPVDTDINAVLAVISVEAGGDGIDPVTKKPVIRFEVHKFYERYGHLNILFDKHFKFNGVEKYRDHKYSVDGTIWKSLHVGSGTARQDLEWEALSLAMSLDPSSAAPAIESTSFGAGQIMGFNYKVVGYTNPFDMMRAAYDEKAQLEMLLNFIDADDRLVKAMREKSWATFARYYNGTGNVPTYSKWLKEAYDLAVSIS